MDQIGPIFIVKTISNFVMLYGQMDLGQHEFDKKTLSLTFSFRDMIDLNRKITFEKM